MTFHERLSVAGDPHQRFSSISHCFELDRQLGGDGHPRVIHQFWVQLRVRWSWAGVQDLNGAYQNATLRALVSW